MVFLANKEHFDNIHILRNVADRTISKWKTDTRVTYSVGILLMIENDAIVEKVKEIRGDNLFLEYGEIFINGFVM